MPVVVKAPDLYTAVDLEPALSLYRAAAFSGGSDGTNVQLPEAKELTP
jgi:hypothetical protein